MKGMVPGVLALLRGHAKLCHVRAAKKVARFERDGEPAIVLDIENLNVVNLWAKMTPMAAQLKCPYNVRPDGIQLNGSLAPAGQPGRHSNVHSFLGDGELLCFHPATLDEAWSVIEALTA